VQCHQPMYPSHSQPLGGHPSLIDCDGALDASSMLTCETPPLFPVVTFIPVDGFVRTLTPSDRNAGRDQIRTLDAISSERLDGFRQNLQKIALEWTQRAAPHAAVQAVQRPAVCHQTA
jgi:hypothetical protein